MANGGKLLSKFRRHEAIARLPLLIQPLELLDATGFYALQIAVNYLHESSAWIALSTFF